MDSQKINNLFSHIMEGAEQTLSVYFLRHGESVANERGIVQGQGDSALSTRGREQAAQAGKWFLSENVRIGQSYSSILQRARTTGDIVSQTLGIAAPRAIPELIELDTGDWSGKNLSDVQKKDPELFQEFVRHSWEAVPGAEKIDSLLTRAYDLWSFLVAESNKGDPDMSILCTSHSGFMQWIFKATFTPAPQHWIPLIPVRNCGVFHFQYSPASETSTKTAARWRLISHSTDRI